MGRPPILLLGLDCRTGLQSARLFAARGVPVVGVAKNRSSPYCRTRAVERILDAARFRDDPAGCLRQLEQEWRAAPVILPCTDEFVLWLDANRDAVLGPGRCVLSPPAAIQTLLDKVKLARFGLEHGLAIPRTQLLRDRRDAENIVNRLDFPVVLKPGIRSSEWLAATAGRKVLRLESAGELLEAYDRCNHEHHELLVQEWIPGSDRDMFSLYTHRTSQGQVAGQVVVQKLRQWPPDTGVGSLAVQVENEAVAALGLDLLARVNFAGLSSVQIKHDAKTGAYYILEVNAGRPALNMTVAELCGVELQMSYYCEAAGLPLPERRTVTRPGGKWICWKTDLAAAWCLWRRGDLDIKTWWRSVSGRKTHAVWSARDPIPFLLDMMRRLGEPRHRRNRRP